MRKLQFLPAVGALLCLLALCFAAHVHRPWINDGSFFYFKALSSGSFGYDPSYRRYFDLVWQVPSLIFAKIYSAHATATRIRALDLAYALHPMLSLSLCALILWRCRRLEAIVFPLLSFAWATQGTVAFSLGMVPDALTVFWPLFLLVLFRKKGSWKSAALIGALELALAFTYETSALFFILIFGVFLLEKGEEQRLSTFYKSSSAAGALFLIYRIIGPTAGIKTNAIQSLLAGPGLYVTYAIAMTGVLSGGLALWYMGREKAAKTVAQFGFGAGFCWMFYVLFTSAYDWKPFIWDAFDARVYAIPIAFVIACCLLVFLKLKNVERVNVALSAVSAVALLIAASYDFRQSLDYGKGIQKAQDFLSAHVGCQKIPRDTWLKEWRPLGLDDWTIPLVSVMLQPDGKVKTLIFTEREPDGFKKLDPCVPANNKLQNDFGVSLPLPRDKGFDYSNFVKNPTEANR